MKAHGFGCCFLALSLQIYYAAALSPLAGKKLIVTSHIGAPFLTIKEDFKKGSNDNDKYEGYVPDLLHGLAQELNFTYQLVMPADNMYGNKMKDNWNGMIGQVISGNADLALADLTITAERESAVDFSLPFMTFGVSILYTKNQDYPSYMITNEYFFKPGMWTALGVTYLIVFLLLAVVAKYSCKTTGGNIGMSSCMWICLGGYALHGSTKKPRTCATRIIMGLWWFFAFIMVVIYTISLQIAMADHRTDGEIENVDDLIRSRVMYGVMKGGSTASFFKNSEFAPYHFIWSKMNDDFPSTVFVKSNADGATKVLVEEGKFAYFGESTIIEYLVERSCHLRQVGGLLNSKGYGIAMTKGSPYRGPLNEALLKMQDNGHLTELKNKWWKGTDASECEDPVGEVPGDLQLGVGYLCSVLVIILVGGILSVVVAVIELMLNAKNAARENDTSYSEAVNVDLKATLAKNNPRMVDSSA